MNKIASILIWWTVGMGMLQFAFAGKAAVLNVAKYGAHGDAVQTLANTVSNSTLVCLATTNELSATDIGKLIELFGVGPATSPTNNQDLIASIVSVTNGTNVTISTPASLTATGVNCTYGTENAGAFQNCINACQGSNDMIIIPAGTYLIVPPQILASNFAMDGSSSLCPAVSISRGGIKMLGAANGTSILLGNGAWILNNGAVERGVIFGCVGPVTNNYPLIFQNLSFNGGVQVGNVGYGTGPADPVTGGGWDVTHDALVDMGEPPFHINKQFINCTFMHWRGEMVKSVVAWNTGYIAVTNCAFWDGDGSGFNYNWTPHVINGCLFSNLNMAVEFYVGTMATNSIFENNVITNTRVAISLVGALTNAPSPGYAIISNSISASDYDICFGPARNVQVIGNTFYGGVIGIATDSAAYQGTDINDDILIGSNQFINTTYPLGVCGAGQDRLQDVTLENNTAYGCANFASGYGWSSNVVFEANASLQPAVNHAGQLDGSKLCGQLFVDDVSDQFQATSVIFSSADQTNIIYYSFGIRQAIYSNLSGIGLLDTSRPQAIPPGAELAVTNASAFPITIYPSDTGHMVDAAILPSGDCFTYTWSNAVWNLAPITPMPPSTLHVAVP
jgi:hypothetical protein